MNIEKFKQTLKNVMGNKHDTLKENDVISELCKRSKYLSGVMKKVLHDIENATSWYDDASLGSTSPSMDELKEQLKNDSVFWDRCFNALEFSPTGNFKTLMHGVYHTMYMDMLDCVCMLISGKNFYTLQYDELQEKSQNS